MKKKDLIKEIKNIIEDYGGFGLGEVEADYSPCVCNEGGLVHLIEYVDLSCKVVVYDDEVELKEYEIPLDKLKTIVLKDLLELSNKYKELQE